MDGLRQPVCKDNEFTPGVLDLSEIRYVSEATFNKRAVSVRQPWAWLIVNGYQDIENRRWGSKHRGPLRIHAGAGKSSLAEDEAWVVRRFGIRLPAEYDFGGIIGVVNVLDCRERSDSPWHEPGFIGWLLGKPRRLPFRPVEAALSLFRPCFNSVFSSDQSITLLELLRGPRFPEVLKVLIRDRPATVCVGGDRVRLDHGKDHHSDGA